MNCNWKQALPFVDLSKNFDTVDHTILLKKLETYGITGANFAWFRSYLRNRKQAIRIINDNETNEQKIMCEVPQKFVLVIFNICKRSSECLRFAKYNSFLKFSPKSTYTRHFWSQI